MSVVKMKKLRIVGHTAEKQKLLTVLHKTGVVEIKRSADYDNTDKKSDLLRRDELNAKLQRVAFSFDFMK